MGGVEVAVHFTGEVISTSERQCSFALPLLGTLAPGASFRRKLFPPSPPPTGGKKSVSHHLVTPEGTSGSATYIKPARPQRTGCRLHEISHPLWSPGVAGKSRHKLPPLLYLFSEVQKTHMHRNKPGFAAAKAAPMNSPKRSWTLKVFA